jgi:hypothetical protein
MEVYIKVLRILQVMKLNNLIVSTEYAFMGDNSTIGISVTSDSIRRKFVFSPSETKDIRSLLSKIRNDDIDLLD